MVPKSTVKDLHKSKLSIPMLNFYDNFLLLRWASRFTLYRLTDGRIIGEIELFLQIYGEQKP